MRPFPRDVRHLAIYCIIEMFFDCLNWIKTANWGLIVAYALFVAFLVSRVVVFSWCDSVDSCQCYIEKTKAMADRTITACREEVFSFAFRTELSFASAVAFLVYVNNMLYQSQSSVKIRKLVLYLSIWTFLTCLTICEAHLHSHDLFEMCRTYSFTIGTLTGYIMGTHGVYEIFSAFGLFYIVRSTWSLMDFLDDDANADKGRTGAKR